MVVIALGVGIVIGVIIAMFAFRRLLIGDLRVDNSIPDEGPYLFLELYRGPQDIADKQHVVLKVNTQSYISHD